MGLTPVGLKDFTPIANFAFDEYMLMVSPTSKYKSMKDLIADAKANPKMLTAGGTQLGSSDSICIYLIEKAAGVQFNFVVFNSGGEVNAALLGCHIQMGVTNPGEALRLYKAGKVKILGVFAEKRLAGAPEIPTMKEQGINTTYVQNRGLCAPAGIPADARKVLEEAFLKYTKTEIFKKYTADNMLSEAWMDGATFGKWLDAENDRYAVIVKDMGLIEEMIGCKGMICTAGRGAASAPRFVEGSIRQAADEKSDLITGIVFWFYRACDPGGLADAPSATFGQARVSPSGSGSFLAVLQAVFAISAWRRRATEKDSEPVFPGKHALLGITLVLVGLAAYIFLIEILGYLVDTFLFIVYLMKVVEREKWPLTLMVAVITTAALFIIFQFLLQIKLPSNMFGL
jgi:hypothetical protein